MSPTRSTCAAVVLLLCTGCVPYWYTPSSSRRSPIDDEALAFITIGSTGMEDVLFELGEPEERYDAPPVFLYRWVGVKGVFVLIPGVPRSGAGGAEWTTEHTLHIAFDESNKVTRYKISTVTVSRQSWGL